MGTIYWRGKNTAGSVHWNAEAKDFNALYNYLINKDIITNSDYDPYDNAVLKKNGKSLEDAEFLDEDGDVNYNKVQAFVEENDLTDKEMWLLIAAQDGDAFYQTFEREDENGDMIKISNEDFDAAGKYQY